MSLADRILGLTWLFPRGDNRKDDVRALANEVRAMEAEIGALRADIVSAVQLIDPSVRPPRFERWIAPFGA